MKKSIFFLAIVVSSVILLTLAKMVASNSLTTGGVSLAKIQEEIHTYKKQNILLEEKLLTVASLTKIASEAGKLGFVKEKSSLYLSNKYPVAFNR